MKRVLEAADWPESWKLSYEHDRLEVYGERPTCGYAYAYRERKKYIVEYVERLLRPGARVFDVAAAQGNFSLTLAELGYRVTWNDLRSDLVDYVKAKYERGHVDYLPGNVLEIATAERFDAVLLAEVIEHVAHPDAFLRKIADFVLPGGWIILTTPNGQYIRNRLPRFSDCKNPEAFEAGQFRPNADGHLFLLHEDEIVRFSTMAGLEVHELRHFCNPLTNGHLKLSALLKIAPQRAVHWLEGASTVLPAALARKVHTATIAVLRRRVS
jgi:2-polyprenyl-3-methyl-5-hydroxy-6-metoxy-1,4-benzoquinol methylase